MAEKVLLKGNEAIAEAAILSGCRYFFGYPITPQTEISAYMAKRMPKIGGVFLQAESEISACNMVYGAAAAGARVMTSSSSPGISLKAEAISYIAGADLPAVVVNIVRAGPGLGGIQPAQSDYHQATKGLGHGDYKMIVLAPSSVQEIINLTAEAFDLADFYRMPVMIIGDGMLGQMMEPVTFELPEGRKLPEKTWATNGTGMKREHNVVNSLYIKPDDLEKIVLERNKKYIQIQQDETKAETYCMEDAEYMITAYGSTARIAKNAVDELRDQGIKVGLVRPITLWPFPDETYKQYVGKVKAILSVEMSLGQMIDDVKLAVESKIPVHFYGRCGGNIPYPDEIIKKMKDIVGGIA
ncbi:MAG: 3-methyl-2-oxobutanoate dehydrogenase subunit VorB [Ruminococcaceae bacterium]|nr:3-methyl-2-oxobutanoate dehydrogenase subunit VorB [Oscillospiraceae bacterium]